MQIDGFHGEYGWLSNFHPCVIYYEGQRFKSVEHAYAAAKTLDLELRELVAQCPTAGKAKRLGRKLQLRADWGEVKLNLMRKFLKQKFLNPVLGSKLILTGDTELVEGNTWGDTYWGVCQGVGENNLGKLLMEIRNNLRN